MGASCWLRVAIDAAVIRGRLADVARQQRPSPRLQHRWRSHGLVHHASSARPRGHGPIGRWPGAAGRGARLSALYAVPVAHQ